MLKKDVMVVGIKVVENNIMQLETTELVGKINKKIKLTELAGMDAVDAAKAIKGTTFHRDKIYVSRDWASKHNIIPFTSLKLTLEKANPEEIKEKYV